MIFLWILAFLVALGSSQPAFAHAPIEGIGAFYNGMLHPALVPTHLMLILGLGILYGQRAPSPGRLGWFGFVAAFWTGLASAQWLKVEVPVVVFLILAVMAGLLVALERFSDAAMIVPVSIAAGLGIGLDSTPATEQEAWVVPIGIAIGGVALISCVGGLAASLCQPWQRIGLRVAGSWIAAASIIVLALALSDIERMG